ncbi:MAG: peptide deformylase [Elusimicrobiota bacterium]|jgi:peptide deformylase|nr:peptide deformylase [Elusimicrobiota bacterium]
MSISEIITIPNPLLRKISQPIENVDEEVVTLVNNLKKTLYFHKNCVGIAAVQTGVLKRIVVTDVSQSFKEHKNNGPIVMINPQIVYSSGKLSSREGCLSVPDFLGQVERKKKIEVEYLDLNEKKQILKTSGFEAIAIQHEIDHLNGKIFLDRVTSLKTDLFRRKR